VLIRNVSRVRKVRLEDVIRVSFDAMEKTRWKKSSSAVLNRSAMTGAKSQVTRLNRAVHTGVDKEGPGGPAPQMAGQKKN